MLSFVIVNRGKWAPSSCRRHRLRHNRTLPHKPIVFIVFLVLSSFCFLLFYNNCVFYTSNNQNLYAKKEKVFVFFLFVVLFEFFILISSCSRSYLLLSKPWHSPAGSRFNQPVSDYYTVLGNENVFFVIF